MTRFALPSPGQDYHDAEPGMSPNQDPPQIRPEAVMDIRLESLLNGSMDGVTLCREDSIVLECNTAFAEMLGYSRDQVIGTPVTIYLSAGSATRFSSLFRRCREGKRTVMELEGLHRNGHSIPLETSFGFDQTSNEQLYVLISRDNRCRRELEDKLRVLTHCTELTLNYAGEGIIGLRPDGTIGFANLAAAQMTRYEVDDLLGQPFHEMLYHSAADGSLRAWDASPVYHSLDTGEGCHVEEETMWRSDDTSFPVEFICRPIQEGGQVVGAALTLRDITERQKAQDRLQSVRFLMSLDHLFAGISHELNTPLSVILGFTELLMAQDLPESTLRDLAKISAEAAHAAHILQNLRRLSVKNKLDTRTVHPQVLIRLALELKAQELRAHNIKVRLDVSPDLPPLLADSDQLTEVLVHLLGNAEDAVLEARAGGHITVSAQRKGNGVLIAITDDGIGIPPELLQRVMDPFFTTKPVGKGTGLGLSIALGIVKAHGGDLWLESASGVGTTVFMQIPSPLLPK